MAMISPTTSGEMPSLTLERGVYVLDLGGGEKRFSADFVQRLRGLLSTVNETEEGTALTRAVQ